MKQQVHITDDPDEFAVLTAMWILASNDEQPIMTYESIRYRLNLPNEYNVKRIVLSRGELFRRGVRPDRLEEWKVDICEKEFNRPSWIRALGDDEVQLEAIHKLGVDDVFRSQFRAKKGAPPSPIPIIDWGLQHIERLREASLESKERVAKSREVRAVLVVTIINILVTILVPIIAKYVG